MKIKNASNNHIRYIFSLIILTILVASCTGGNEPIIDASDSPGITEQIKKSPVLMYGIDVDSFEIITGSFRKNEFLGDILQRHGVDWSSIDYITKNHKDVFDVRRIRTGGNYTLFLTSDTNQALRYLVYEHDLTRYYLFSFNGTPKLTEGITETETRMGYASGVIETSLWESTIKNGINPMVAIELSEIYAWSIDFFGLQKGDSYRVIYEERFSGSQSVGIERIHGALFSHAGHEFYAIPLVQDSISSFYDLEGNSLRKAFLKAPLRFSRISSGFSSSRMHPILRIRRPHFGVDYAAPLGTPVVSIGDGKVTSATYEKSSGYILRIRHNSVYSTAYLHLSRFGKGVKAGSFVKQGDVIGYVGSTGLSTGPHLDFRVYRNGSPVDPLKVDSPPVEPVSESNIDKFKKVKSVITQLLETVNEAPSR